MDDGIGIRISDLSKRFETTEAVGGVSLEIREGETFGLLGPNGAGKTTTLSMLATLVEPSAGDAEIFGASLRRDVASVKRAVGLAPQQISLYPALSGEENLLFFGRLHGIRGQALRARAERLLDLVGLTPRRGDLVRTYSGGMQRRLNLVCSLIHEPRLLMLDEPTVGVDPHSRDNIFEVVKQTAEAGTTVLYTTHYMEEAERLCDRIAILDEGRVIALGTLAELLEIVGMGEVIEIRTRGRPLDGRRLDVIPDLVSIDAAPGLTRIFVKSAPRALAPLAALLAEESHEVERLEIYPVNLDRVFMRLTGRALRD
jgi:ABC-2 type transport system ATP-binding protein